jgi:hypothetical protein
LTPEDVKRVAGLWMEWADARITLRHRRRSVAASLSALPGSVAAPLEQLTAHAIADCAPHHVIGLPSAAPLRAVPFRNSVMYPSVDLDAPQWARGLLGASPSASAAASQISTMLFDYLKDESLMASHFQCSLLHSGRGFDVEQAARLLGRWEFEGMFHTADHFRVAEMAYRDLTCQAELL